MFVKDCILIGWSVTIDKVSYKLEKAWNGTEIPSLSTKFKRKQTSRQAVQFSVYYSPNHMHEETCFLINGDFTRNQCYVITVAFIAFTLSCTVQVTCKSSSRKLGQAWVTSLAGQTQPTPVRITSVSRTGKEGSGDAQQVSVRYVAIVV